MPLDRDYQLKPFIKVIRPTYCPCNYNDSLTGQTKDTGGECKSRNRKEISENRSGHKTFTDTKRTTYADVPTEKKLKIPGGLCLGNNANKPSNSKLAPKCTPRNKRDSKPTAFPPPEKNNAYPNKELKFKIRLMEQILFDLYDLLDNYLKFARRSSSKSLDKVRETMNYLIDMLSARLTNLGLKQRTCKSSNNDANKIMESAREAMIEHNFLLDECLELKISVYQEYRQALSMLWQNLNNAWAIIRTTNILREIPCVAEEDDSLTDIIVQYRNSYKRIKHIFQKYKICDPKVVNRGLVKLKLESVAFLEKYKRLCDTPEEENCKEQFCCQPRIVPVTVPRTSVGVGIQCKIAQETQKKDSCESENPTNLEDSETNCMMSYSEEDMGSRSTDSQGPPVWQKHDWKVDRRSSEQPYYKSSRSPQTSLSEKYDNAFKLPSSGRREQCRESMLFAGGAESSTKMTPDSSTLLSPLLKSRSLIYLSTNSKSSKNVSFSYSDFILSDHSSKLPNLSSLQEKCAYTYGLSKKKDFLMARRTFVMSQTDNSYTNTQNDTGDNSENSFRSAENNTSLELLLSYPDKFEKTNTSRDTSEDDRQKHHCTSSNCPMAHMPLCGTKVPINRYPRFKYVKTENYLSPPGEDGSRALEKRIYLPVPITKLRNMEQPSPEKVDYNSYQKQSPKCNCEQKQGTLDRERRPYLKYPFRIPNDPKTKLSKKAQIIMSSL